MGVGCRLYHAGSPRGPAYESHPWRKGWLYFVKDVVVHTSRCSNEAILPQVGVAFEGEPMLELIRAMRWVTPAHCSGFQWGMPLEQPLPHTHRFEEHGGEKNWRRIPTISHLQP